MGDEIQVAPCGDGSELTGCENHFRSLHEKSGLLLTESLGGDRVAQQAKSLTFAADLQNWCENLGPLSKTDALVAAVSEYEFSLLALVQGHYRHAFMGLRLCLELSLACVHFAANRLKFREWLDGRGDIVWGRLVDDENGVLSKRFAHAFFPELSEDAPHYNALAKTVYRECSEYVHGNPRANVLLAAPLSFNEEAFGRRHELADVVTLVISFALSMAFLRDLDDPSRNELESTILDRLGHVAAIRGIFGGPLENGQ